jgi:hypothetical protein
LPRGQALDSYIEWEDFEHNWKINTLEASESLPQGAVHLQGSALQVDVDFRPAVIAALYSTGDDVAVEGEF